MTAEFKDLFSVQAAKYAKYRPSYPSEIYTWLVSQVRERQRAWDVGTGNGQAAVALAQYFDEVIATDLSAAQIEQATPHARVRYAVGTCEHVDLPAQSVDLITVAQAAHWFNFEKFYAEVRRVGKPQAVIALWSYGHNWHVTPSIDAIMGHYFKEIVGPYWAPEVRLVWDEYKTIPFPFEEIPAPKFSMSTRLDYEGLVGYLSSWSSTQKYLQVVGQNPLALIEADFQKAWGDLKELKTITWSLHFRVGRLA